LLWALGAFGLREKAGESEGVEEKVFAPRAAATAAVDRNGAPSARAAAAALIFEGIEGFLDRVFVFWKPALDAITDSQDLNVHFARSNSQAPPSLQAAATWAGGRGQSVFLRSWAVVRVHRPQE
jgi:hypothetical protein